MKQKKAKQKKGHCDFADVKEVKDRDSNGEHKRGGHMLRKGHSFRRYVVNESRFWRSLLLTMALAVTVVAGVLFASPASAQQRIIIEKATGNVVDVGDKTLEYDKRYFDLFEYAGEAIPSGANFRKYMRDAKGAIVLRPKDELLGNFEDARRSDLIARISAAALPPLVRAASKTTSTFFV